MFYVSRNGEQKGPFEAEIIMACLKQGTFDYSDLVWKEGWENWREIKDVFPESASKPPPLDKANDKAQCPFCDGPIELGVIKCTHCNAKLTPRALKARLLRLGCAANLLAILLAIFGFFLLAIFLLWIGGTLFTVLGPMGLKAIPLTLGTIFLWLGVNHLPTQSKKFYCILGFNISWIVFSILSTILGAVLVIFVFIS